MKYNAYANIRDNKVNIDVVKQTRKRLKLNYKVQFKTNRVMGPTPWYLISTCNHNIAYYLTLPYQSYGFNLAHLLVNQIIIPTMTGVDGSPYFK